MGVGARVPRGYSTVSDSTRIRNNSLYIGFITENSDAQRMGRLKVWIPELGSGGSEDPNSWILVSYVSPFAGATNPTGINGSSQTSSGSQQSYGMWMIPPDLGNQVLVGFVNGEINRGYWLGCVWQQNMNHMVPGIPCNVPTGGASGTSLPPVVEYNKINQTDPTNPQRPAFTPLANGLSAQGLQGDPERGPSSTSARREAPSAVFGLLTPRGNSFNIDDNPDNEFIRIRTRSGTQILVDETTGMVYINSKLGNAWMEVSDFGVDIYSANSVSIRAQQDFNVRADRNIIFDAGSNILLKAGQDVNIQSGNDIVLGSNNQLVMSSTNNMSLTVGENLNLSVTGNMATQAAGNISDVAAGVIARAAPQILDNSGGTQNVTANPAVVPQPKSVPDVENGSSATLETIVSRMPTHEPWAGHPHIGVPVSPGEPNTANGPQGPVGFAMSMGSTTIATGTGNKTIVQNILPGCAPATATSGRFGIGIPTVSYNAIKTASSSTGAPFGTMMAIANCESGFQPSAQFAPGAASGLFQFEPDTYQGMVNQYGSQYNLGSGDILDPNANATAGGLYINQNIQTLKSNGIANPTAGDTYLCHMLGGGGGSEFISAVNSNPNEPVSSLGSPLAGYIADNPGWLNGSYTGNNLGSNPTVGDYYNNITGYMNQLASQYDSEAGLPAPCDRDGSSPTNTMTVSGNLPNTTGVSTTGSSLNGVLGNV